MSAGWFPKKASTFCWRRCRWFPPRLPDFRAVIVGDGPLRAELEEQARQWGLSGSVRFEGAQPNARVRRYMTEARVFALACRYVADGDSDALPVVIREAMACGTPVISTTVAGIPETVAPDTGWLAPPEDAAALAEVLIEALSDPTELERRGAAARQRVADHYTLERAANEMREVFARRRAN